MNREDWDIKLVEYVANEITDDEEKRTIESWIEEREENRKYFEQMQINYLRQRWFFRSRLISRKGELKRDKKKWQIIYISSIAASVLLVCSAFLLWHGEKNEIQKAEIYTADRINPGTFRAELLLASGKKVELTKKKKDIQEQAPVSVLTNECGELIYQLKEGVLSEGMHHILLVDKGCEYKVCFSDGSVAWINSATRLEYPIVFTGDKRVVKLQGEAYFQVKSDSTKPFIVMAEGVEIKVTGTEFNVNTHWHNSVETVLVKGQVFMQKDNRLLRLKPLQKAVYDALKDSMSVEEVDVDKYIAWKNGDFIFSEERLEDIMNKLSLWYDCHVFYRNQTLKDIHLSGDMKRYGKIEELLHFFESSMDIKFEINGKTIVVENK